MAPTGVSASAEQSLETAPAQGALIGSPLGMMLAVVGSGVRMPALQVAAAQPVQVVMPLAARIQPAMIETPLAPKPAYIAPVYPRKQDRN